MSDGEYICDNGETLDKWYCEDGVYVRRNSKGLMTGRITPENLPDPHALYEQRKKLNPSVRDTAPAVYKLWEHAHAGEQ